MMKGEQDLSISLRAARVNAGLTQEKVANQLGKNVMTISNWENGKTYPNSKDLQALSHLYGVDLYYLRLAD